MRHRAPKFLEHNFIILEASQSFNDSVKETDSPNCGVAKNSSFQGSKAHLSLNCAGAATACLGCCFPYTAGV